MSRRKKVLFLTDHPLAKTGFGRNAKAILEYLYQTNKYELINLAVGTVNSPDLTRTPWKTLPTVNPQQIEEIKKQNDPRSWEAIDRMSGYGAYAVDAAVKNEKPDVFIAAQDIWGIDFCIDKCWFSKISSALWTTLDSRPILPKAVEVASKIKHFWSWADFATQDLKKMGHPHVQTVRGALDTKLFYRLNDELRKKLRKKHNISENDWIIGFVFRNQLRKSVPNLLQGYKLFTQRNPEIKSKLLLHTHWAEGWDIPKLLDEHQIDKKEVLTTFVCRACKNYEIKPFLGQEQDCPHCRTAKAQITTHPALGVSETELNEIYNLMDVYVHPFTSGGQEIPVEEAKLTELITLVTNYSCGEDLCIDASGSLPLDWSEYREPGTQFIKASTYPSSIAKQLEKIYNLKDSTKKELGKKSRQWVINNFAVEHIGQFLENFIDSSPFVSREDYLPADEKDDVLWLKQTYHGFLGQDLVEDSEEFKLLINT